VGELISSYAAEHRSASYAIGYTLIAVPGSGFTALPEATSGFPKHLTRQGGRTCFGPGRGSSAYQVPW
jgi:hypothetical protein